MVSLDAAAAAAAAAVVRVPTLWLITLHLRQLKLLGGTVATTVLLQADPYDAALPLPYPALPCPACLATIHQLGKHRPLSAQTAYPPEHPLHATAFHCPPFTHTLHGNDWLHLCTSLYCLHC